VVDTREDEVGREGKVIRERGHKEGGAQKEERRGGDGRKECGEIA